MERDPTAPLCRLTYGQLAPKPIKCFSGFDDQDFEAWLRKFEDTVRMVTLPLPDQLRINTLVGFLEGGARDLIDDLSEEDKNSYLKVIDHLRTHFASQQFRSLARQQLSDSKQSPTESARDFADRIKHIVRKVTRGQPKQAQSERLLDEFQDRLKPALKFHVKVAKLITFDEAVVKAITYESLLNDVANAIAIFPGAQSDAPPPVRVVSMRSNSNSPTSGLFQEGQRRRPLRYR
ncbi:hypothetical protein V3C99_018341 [Haemonchus contortus]|uniref:Retrotrans_gag domain-containing protein n=1 Tax=Haemonchus contortus TaxID=6289 RepID=A0A7I4Z1J8_HAECO